MKQGKDDSKIPSNPEDLRRDSVANSLIAFTYNEPKIITQNFRQDRVLGRMGYGSVYKGVISQDLREGFPPLPVAVKVHDGNNSYRGHRQWLVIFTFFNYSNFAVPYVSSFLSVCHIQYLCMDF